ncbi:bifunctional 2-polyprenyl-6-hydroxyphenol methylase/3-demethylubiquinol 3-O-methyltransferase UbiG [Granulicella sp. S156]|uniref:class I SAM-dependent methyltransferase n=1 Tax=Granulicella sp. S156 TaxID=1747224 RepID=UPI00131D4020|nr:class I SAM-dependent methyltransferase [Granulicella sp. S156]
MNKVAQLQRYWENEYESTTTPFDSEKPDEWIATLEKVHKIKGDVLDAGSGPGRTSIYLADLGYNVLGIDISTKAIERAKLRAAEKGNTAQFLQANLFELPGYDHYFDTVVDIGCFHSLYDDNDRASYAATLHRMCRPGAIIYLRAFSASNPKKVTDPTEHSPDLHEDQIRAAFSANGWDIKVLEERGIDLWISDEMTLKSYFWFAEIHHA